LLKDAWTLAIEALSWIELQKLSERLALTKTARQLNITDTSAKGLAHRLVYETIRRKNYLDSLISYALKPHTIDDYELGLRAFLRLYVYKTSLKRKGDAHKEAIEIARMGRSILGWQTLQPIEKALGTLLSPQQDKVLEKLGDEEKVALQTYHPTWFVKYCFKLFGRNEALKFLSNSQNLLPIYIRVNTLITEDEKAIETLQREGVRVEKVLELGHVYRVVHTKHPLASTDGFKEGLFCVQDKASCLAVEVATPKPDMTVFDVCCAPGSKTTHLAALMQNRGAIYSLDYSRRRMKVWKRGFTRGGAKNALPIIADAGKPLPFNKTADLVILDPPCTSTGVFARAPSAKWRLTQQSIPKMAEVQWPMLRNCAEKVIEGGSLVYSTCSISVEENEMQIGRFLRLYPEFRLAETKPWIGLPGLRGLTRCQRLYPHIHDCNGFFIAKLEKET
jgi:16S rRNA (cytosine967-C5)-methyltransferase